MRTPEQVKGATKIAQVDKVEQVINAIDTEIDSRNDWTEWYKDGIEILLSKEYPKHIRDEVAARYVLHGGWSKVEHKTSSENGERPGLTLFELYY